MPGASAPSLLPSAGISLPNDAPLPPVQAVREAIKSFGEDAEIRVFLLSHRAGATGALCA